MIVIGLTGGIGAGKSTVANYFKELGVPVYIADDEAKRLMHSSKIVRQKIIAEFGSEAYIDNNLNRPFIAAIVFNDKSKLTAISAIVHPSVSNSFKRWTGKQTAAYVLQENAVLFENNTAHKFDYIITVTAPVEERIKRVIKRDTTTRSGVLARMNNQLSDKEKIKKSDFVIHAIDKVITKKEVLKIHKKLLKLAKQKID